MFLSQPREGAISFAEPSAVSPQTDAFTQTLATAPLALTRLWNAASGFPVDDPAVRTLFTAAERRTRLVDQATGQIDALAEAADHRIKTAQQQTGEQLENPFRQGYFIEAQRRYDDIRGRGDDPGPRGPAVERLMRDIFSERVNDLAERYPDKAAALSFHQPLEDQARAISAGAAVDARTAEAAGVDTLTSLGTEFAAAFVAARRDPLLVSSLFFGPATAAGKTALARVGSSALNQGLYNAGVSLLGQPAVQAWRREIGEKSGLVPAATEVGLAFLLGAIPGAAIEGMIGRNFDKLGREALERIARNEPQPGDVAIAAKALDVELAPQEARNVAAGETSNLFDDIASAGAPPGLPPERSGEIAAQAIRHGEDPVNAPPPELAPVLPARPADQVTLLDEGVAPRAREMVDGKPVTFARFDPRQLTSDAATFQYKGGADAAGVTDRLRFVETWDPTASGKGFVFEKKDGTLVVADGHQRLGLANKILADQPDAAVAIDGFRFREADGWTAADVRALAAKKNMQEGSGDALDAARILRERPDLLDGSLPVSSPMMKNAVALSRLSDEAFGMAINGVVPANYAAAVGAMVSDRLQHAAVMADLARFAPETEREARLLIGEALSAGFTAEHQINLFGAAETARSLLVERVKTLDAALQGLVKDKKLFGTLAEKADTIEAAGNRLARNVNDQRASDAARLAELVSKLAQRTGPVSDALNRAAAQVAEGAKPAKAAETFLDELRALLDKDGLPALLASPELKPRVVVEPGTPEAVEAAQVALSERTDAGEQSLLPGVEPVTDKARAQLEADKPLRGGDAEPGGLFGDASKQTDLIDAIAVAARTDGQDTRFISREAALEEANKPADYANIIKSCKD